ncbi:hypothetical protein [Streptomyces sp. SAS_281]|uniref:hypothetical protein n=1 Tax=Streptomyces sp. SAS_281 TaxID=3412744 RepID=UPI00403D05DE
MLLYEMYLVAGAPRLDFGWLTTNLPVYPTTTLNLKTGSLPSAATGPRPSSEGRGLVPPGPAVQS